MKPILILLLSIFGAQASAGAAQPLPEPRTPDQLIENFERAINEGRIDEYERVLHTNFQFYLAPDDRALTAPDTTWGRERELLSMSRLLSGEAGLSHAGEFIPPATEIEFGLIAIGEWAHEQSVVETWTRTYHGLLKVNFDDGSRWTVSRRQTFTLTALRSESDLRPTQFRMLSWKEHGKCGCPSRPVGMERARY